MMRAGTTDHVLWTGMSASGHDANGSFRPLADTPADQNESERQRPSGGDEHHGIFRFSTLICQ
jgi:hypothetical protein